MENGADLTILKQCLNRLYKTHQNRDAGMLKLVAAGGIWTNGRKYEAGLIDSPLCPDCQICDEDEYHFF